MNTRYRTIVNTFFFGATIQTFALNLARSLDKVSGQFLYFLIFYTVCLQLLKRAVILNHEPMILRAEAWSKAKCAHFSGNLEQTYIWLIFPGYIYIIYILFFFAFLTTQLFTFSQNLFSGFYEAGVISTGFVNNKHMRASFFVRI